MFADLSFLYAKLRYAHLKTNVHTQNLMNASVPGYKALEPIDFGEFLRNQRSALVGLAQTHQGHLQGDLQHTFLHSPVSVPATAGGNTVDTMQELAHLKETDIAMRQAHVRLESSIRMVHAIAGLSRRL